MTNDELTSVFFYASRDARFYDLMADLTQPHLALIHDTMIELLAYSLGQDAAGRPLRVLVAGSGTGAEVLRILDRLPEAQVVAVDFSPAMNEQLRSKLETRSNEKRVAIVEIDFFDDILFPEITDKTGFTTQCGFDAAVAGFFLHHYDLSAKRKFFRVMHALLKPGGALIHGDLFNFRSLKLSHYAHAFGERWLIRQMSNPDAALRANFDALGQEVHRLREEWVRHWNTTHLYTPIENCERDYEKEPGQAALAREAGFIEVGCPFRLWEVGVMWALKDTTSV